MGRRIELSRLEYDVLWEHLRLGPFPPVLDIESHGATADERAELVAKAWDSLADKDLGWPSALDGRLAFRLRLLANPPLELDARLKLSEGPRTSALIAAGTTIAAVAVLDSDRLSLHTAPRDRLSHAALGLLPQHPPGSGNSITVPAQALDTAAQAGNDPAAFAKALATLGVGRNDTNKIVHVTANVTRYAHFGAARTPPHGRRQRAGYVVSVYDTPHGRYLFTRRHLWVTLLPGTEAAILRQLNELVAELS